MRYLADSLLNFLCQLITYIFAMKLTQCKFTKKSSYGGRATTTVRCRGAWRCKTHRELKT